METDTLTYAQVVERFRTLTSAKHPNGYCCKEVDNGVPHCCGAPQTLLFTYQEIYMIHLEEREFVWDEPYFRLNSRLWPPDRLDKELHDGILADTLECASWPIIPVLKDGKVVDIHIDDSCNADISDYESKREELTQLWKRAVELTGVKPYYLESK